MASSLNALILCTTPLGMKISPSSGVYIFVSDPSVTSILPLMTWWISSWVSCQCGGTLNAMSSAVEFNWEAIIWTRTTQSLSFRKVCERRAQLHVCQCRYQFRWTWTYHRDAICEGYSRGKSISFGCHTEVRWGVGLNLQCNLHYQDEEFINHYITHGRMSECHVWALRNQPAAQRTLTLRKMRTHQKHRFAQLRMMQIEHRSACLSWSRQWVCPSVQSCPDYFFSYNVASVQSSRGVDQNPLKVSW